MTAPTRQPQMREDPRFPGALIHESSYVDEGAAIGPGTKIWHFSHILPGTVIGADCSIGQNCMIGPDVRIGRGARIQNNVSIYAGVELDEDVFCGPSCVFTNVTTPRANVSRKAEFGKTRVGRGVTIGANATIVCGHDLAPYSFIGAGAVVTKSVMAHALMIGNPARRIGWMSRSGDRLGADLTCPRTGERYEVQPDGAISLVGEGSRTAR